MMLKGTPSRGKGEFARLVEQNGGQDNAFTTQDATSYYVDIAADKVEMVLGLEADRMRHLLLDAKEIDSERQVVMEERRTRTEDDADGLLSEELNSLAFKAHPYRWPVIGWMEDIRRINSVELRAFYDTYYQPNNALLLVAGEILAAARRLFGASQKVADFLIGIEEQGLGLDYPERFKAGIAKVTAADVQRAAAQYLDPATFSSVIVGK